ncbi:16333_t:CDS:2, partial [Entrophospora sp. SA101]
IADLEISIKSLMKINSELDATNKKQAIEIQDLARRLQMYVNSEENRKESDIRFRKICLVIDTLIRDGKNALEYKSKIGGSRVLTNVQLEKKTPDLIAKNTICADITDPFLEPGLFQLMTMYQIHRCVGEKCGDPGTNANPCKKGFPRPLSNFTYSEQNSKRYIYQRTKDEDHWEIGINGTDDIAVAVFNNKVFIGGSILPSAPSELRI